MNVMWVFLGLIGAIVLYLVLSSDDASTFGMANSEFAQVAAMSIWGSLIATAVLPRKGQFKEFAKNISIWVLIILCLSAGYIFRYDLQDIASRMSAGLVPGSPRSVQLNNGRERVVLTKAGGNHFLARAKVNGTTTRLLVDTGASSIVLTERDAEAAGINLSELNYNVPSQTANGIAYFARARADSVELGPIQRENIGVLVGTNAALGQSLLGMNFLNSLSSFEFRGDELYLTD